MYSALKRVRRLSNDRNMTAIILAVNEPRSDLDVIFFGTSCQSDPALPRGLSHQGMIGYISNMTNIVAPFQSDFSSNVRPKIVKCFKTILQRMLRLNNLCPTAGKDHSVSSFLTTTV